MQMDEGSEGRSRAVSSITRPVRRTSGGVESLSRAEMAKQSGPKVHMSQKTEKRTGSISDLTRTMAES